MRAALFMGMAALASGGCASQSFSMHGLPPETPAADNAAAIQAAAVLAAADAPSMYTYDPWERVNRFTYRFNARFDEAVFLPVANGYRRVPAPIRSGVHNFFENLSELDS